MASGSEQALKKCFDEISKLVNEERREFEVKISKLEQLLRQSEARVKELEGQFMKSAFSTPVKTDNILAPTTEVYTEIVNETKSDDDDEELSPSSKCG